MLCNSFNTSNFFAGGAGMFIQYHDIIKPVYLYAIIKMLLSNNHHGLPVDQLSNFSPFSLVEWYISRRYQNPIKSIDYNNILDIEECDRFLLQEILNKDPSIYDTAPLLSISKMMQVYTSQKMSCPIYIYTREFEPNIKPPFAGINTTYLYGDLETAIRKCDHNFTYILSEIELVKEVSELLKGTCSHILLPKEYRYNKSNEYYKYNLQHLEERNQYVRIGAHTTVTPISLVRSITELIIGGSN